METTQVQVDSSPVLIAVDLYHDCDSVIVSQFMPHQKTVHKSNSVSLTLVTVTRSEHYHIVPVDSTDSCHDFRNGTCFTLEQLVQIYLLSGGDNLTLSFLPGDHVLTDQLLIRNFSHVQITRQNTSTTVVRLHNNGTIRFVSSIHKLNIGFHWNECLTTKLTSRFDH